MLGYLRCGGPDATVTDATCTLTLSGSGFTGGDRPLGTGVVHASYPIGAKAVIDTLRIRCTGAGSATVDWLTVQNGPYEWPPLQDLGIGFESMQTPGFSSPANVIRASEDGSWAFMASDGGFAWSDDLYVWHQANGDGTDLAFIDQLDFSDLLPVDLGGPFPRVWALGGDLGGAESQPDVPYSESALWYTDDLGTTWEEAVHDAWSNYRVSDCNIDPGTGASWARSDSFTSGRRMIQHPVDPSAVLYLDNRQQAFPLKEPGLYYYDGTAGCRVTDDLPEELNLSALAQIEGYDDRVLYVVGSRTPGYGMADPSTVYICEHFTELECGLWPPFPSTCTPIHDGSAPWTPDVRDIVVDPRDPHRFFLVDGGFRNDDPTNDDGVPHTCSFDLSDHDSTVYELVEDASGGWTITDTDPAPVPDLEAPIEPDWIGLTDATDFASGCGGTVVYDGDDNLLGYLQWGNLVTWPLITGTTNGTESSSLSTLAIDPSGRWMFTSFIGGDSGYGRGYGCPSIYRYDRDAEEPRWEPLSGMAADRQEDSTQRSRRRYVSTFEPAAIDAEPWPEGWTQRWTFELEFVPDPLGGDPDLFVSNMMPFVVPPNERVSVFFGIGWDIPWETADPDFVQHDVAMLDGEESWADFGPSELAVCHDCGDHDEVHVSEGQVGDYYGFSEDTSGHRDAADRECHTSTAGTMTDVDVWQEAGSDFPAERWWAIGGGSKNLDTDGDGVNDVATHDPYAVRGLVFAVWDDESDPSYDDDEEVGWSGPVGTPCWDFWSSDVRNTWMNDATFGEYALDCSGRYVSSDDVERPWYGCDGDPESPWNIAEAAVGDVQLVMALDHHTALVGTVDACTNPWAETGACLGAEAGGGLWVVRHADGVGLSWQAVTGLGTVDVDGDDSSACDESDLFAMGWLGPPDLVVDRWTWTQSRSYGVDGNPEGSVRLFLLSGDDDCGILEINFELGPTPSSSVGTDLVADWEAIDWWDDSVGDGFELDTNVFYPVPSSAWGLNIDRDGRWLYVFGGAMSANGAGGTNDVDGVTAIEVGLPRGDYGALFPPTVVNDVTYTSTQVQPYPMESAVKRSEIPGAHQAFLPHPHLQGQAFLGLSANAECDACLLPLGVFSVQRRFRPWAAGEGADDWAWGSMRLPNAADLEFRFITDLDWGNAGPDDTMRNLYIGTNGGGLWEGEVTW